MWYVPDKKKLATLTEGVKIRATIAWSKRSKQESLRELRYKFVSSVSGRSNKCSGGL